MSSYWNRNSPSPTALESLSNASYWDADHANTVYSTGPSTQPSPPPGGATSAPQTTDRSAPTGDDRTNPTRQSNDPRLKQDRGERSQDDRRRDDFRNKGSRRGQGSDRGGSMSNRGSAGLGSGRPQNEEKVDRPQEKGRDPRQRKRTSDGQLKPDTVSRPRDPPPDRPDTITRANVDRHRLVHESDHEWNLRRQFLVEHCAHFPTIQLECLSQVFINMECLGSVYPKDTMDRVREMSSHMSQELTQLRDQKKVKINFVKEGASQSNKDDKAPPKRYPQSAFNKRDQDTSPPKKLKPIAFVKPTTSSGESHQDAKKKEEPSRLLEKPARRKSLVEMKEDVKSTNEDEAENYEGTTEEEEEDEEEEVVVPDGIDVDEAESDEEEKEERPPSSSVQELEQLLEESTTEPEDCHVEDNSISRKKEPPKSKRKKDQGPQPSAAMQTLMRNKNMYAQNKTEQVMYDFAHSLAKIANEKKQPKNPLEFIHMGSTWAKLPIEYRFEACAGKRQRCFLLLNAVVLAIGEQQGKKMAKREAVELALEKLHKPCLRVMRVNPERQELQASDQPFANQLNAPKLAVLGGGEVARRGMRTVNKTQRDDFILVDYSHGRTEFNASTMIQQSADFNKVALKWDFEDVGAQVTCRILLDHEEYESYTAANRQLAKLNVAEHALERLQATNWTIKVKTAADTASLGLSKEEILGDLNIASEAIPESNIGSKLLKKMGWTGGGVGKKGQGIAEPIKADTTLVRREGFGLSSAKGLGRDFKTKVKAVLGDYSRSQRQDDMRFSPDFNNEERAVVHTEARKIGLRSRSYGQGEERYLVVGRKRSATQLLTHVMSQGGSTSKYELVAPRTGGPR